MKDQRAESIDMYNIHYKKKVAKQVPNKHNSLVLSSKLSWRLLWEDCRGGGDRQTTNLRFHTAQLRFRLLTSCSPFLLPDITTSLSKELAANKKDARMRFAQLRSQMELFCSFNTLTKDAEKQCFKL